MLVSSAFARHTIGFAEQPRLWRVGVARDEPARRLALLRGMTELVQRANPAVFCLLRERATSAGQVAFVAREGPTGVVQRRELQAGKRHQCGAAAFRARAARVDRAIDRRSTRK